MLFKLLGITFFVSLVVASPPPRYNTNSTRKDGILNVHIISHTHDDVGWLKTVDGYFYGAQNYIQNANVRSILGSVVGQLVLDPNRKFIYVEQAFFQRWYQEQNADMQKIVQGLVKSGQLEFINGGWCMHDEAAPTFIDMIDQTSLGHRYIMEQFGVAPRATWQIDPFGHTGFQASMMSSPLSGFNSVFFARADYEDFAKRKKEKSSEFFWYPSPSQGESAATLGGILADYYYPPEGFNFGGDPTTQPIMDDPNLNDYNVVERVQDFVQTVQTFAEFTAGEDVMVMMGTDFSYENAPTWFENIDRLIHYCNQDGRINAFYSSPAIYADAKIKTVTLPTRTDDMMPYADQAHAVWAGYFTSRPALKGYVRYCSAAQIAARQLQVLSGGTGPAGVGPLNPLYLLEHALAVLQHHDAVSGTSKQAVADDYAQRLSRGVSAAETLFDSALRKLTGTDAPFVACHLSNATICPALEGGVPQAVVLYNPRSFLRAAAPVLVPVPLPTGTSYIVYGPDAVSVQAQILPASAVDTNLREKYYSVPASAAMAWLAFEANVPSVGFATYFIVPTKTVSQAPKTFISKSEPLKAGSADQTLSNQDITLTVSGTNGLLSNYESRSTGIKVPLTQDFCYYISSNGSPPDGTPDYQQHSGAYIFRPNETACINVRKGAVAATIIRGPIVSVVRQVFSNWVSQCVRLWNSSTTVEFESTVGPLPDDTNPNGVEVVTRFSTNMATKGVWYTDSNGRDSMRRVRNSRPTWNLTVAEPVADNYYPVNAFAYTEADDTVLSVIPDRSEGMASLKDGQLEFMVHRRILIDDNRGVDEPLDEPGVDGYGLIVRMRHLLSFDKRPHAAASRRELVSNALFPLNTHYASMGGLTPTEWVGKFNSHMSGLDYQLPRNVQLLTSQAQAPGVMLLRLAHMYEVGEDSVLSKPVTVAIAKLFRGLTVTDAVEMTLTGNMELTKAPKTVYNIPGKTVTLPEIPHPPAGDDLSITLAPMQIRTFRCTYLTG